MLMINNQPPRRPHHSRRGSGARTPIKPSCSVTTRRKMITTSGVLKLTTCQIPPSTYDHFCKILSARTHSKRPPTTPEMTENTMDIYLVFRELQYEVWLVAEAMSTRAATHHVIENTIMPPMHQTHLGDDQSFAHHIQTLKHQANR